MFYKIRELIAPQMVLQGYSQKHSLPSDYIRRYTQLTGIVHAWAGVRRFVLYLPRNINWAGASNMLHGMLAGLLHRRNSCFWFQTMTISLWLLPKLCLARFFQPLVVMTRLLQLCLRWRLLTSELACPQPNRYLIKN